MLVSNVRRLVEEKWSMLIDLERSKQTTEWKNRLQHMIDWKKSTTLCILYIVLFVHISKYAYCLSYSYWAHKTNKNPLDYKQDVSRATLLFGHYERIPHLAFSDFQKPPAFIGLRPFFM